jgi:putative two-component system response regulator
MDPCCSNPKILFVDDSRTMLFVLRAHLSGCHFELLDAPDGVTAMRYAMKVRPAVIISDVEMPGVSGIDLCRLVRSAPGLKHTRMILISSKWTTARRREVESIGVDGMLPKPIEPDVLKQMVVSLVVRGSK